MTITAVRPEWVVPGARLAIAGRHLPLPADGPPHVFVGTHEAQVVAASHTMIRIVVPAAAEGGAMPVRVTELTGETAFVHVARSVVTGVHQVDSPAFDAAGRLYATQSGGRGVNVPVPLYRIGRDGTREPLALEIANPTSVTRGPDDAMYVSSRFDGQVHRVTADGHTEVYASDLGVPTGLAFAPDGSLFVGDRSGSVLRILPSRRVESFATIPASIAAFHLAYGPDDCLYVTAPTLSTRDPIYRITPDRLVDTYVNGLGRPQGLAFDATGALYVVDALAGSAGLYRVDVTAAEPAPALVLTAPSLVGVAFDPDGGLLLAAHDTIWRLDVPLRPWTS